jgi:hypothetical protein
MTEYPVNNEAPNPAVTRGLDSFGDVHADSSGKRFSDSRIIRNLVDEGCARRGNRCGLLRDREHYTESFPLSAGDVAPEAIAARTSRIRLGSAVTVISSDDPGRVFHRYSTLDSVSSGRAEVILGRGSSTESFPLFGYDLSNYDELFEEKVNLFAELLREKPGIPSDQSNELFGSHVGSASARHGGVGAMAADSCISSAFRGEVMDSASPIKRRLLSRAGGLGYSKHGPPCQGSLQRLPEVLSKGMRHWTERCSESGRTCYGPG